jgi:hypothetical protein
MKLMASFLIFTSFNSFAAFVNSARLDDAKKNILVDVSYGGGCKEHSFQLDLRMCIESTPPVCVANLVHTIEGGFDPCESFRFETLVFNLEQYELTDSFYSNASLTIRGDVDDSGEKSKAIVILPE